MFEILARGVQINSALYLAACFVAGLVERNPWAWKLAVAAMGVAYLSYTAQLNNIDGTSGMRAIGIMVAVVASVGIGAAAGIALLVG